MTFRVISWIVLDFQNLTVRAEKLTTTNQATQKAIAPFAFLQVLTII